MDHGEWIKQRYACYGFWVFHVPCSVLHFPRSECENKMHILKFTYIFKHMRRNATVKVVVLAIVRPPPIRVYVVVVDPVGAGGWQGFFCALLQELKRNVLINKKRF